MRFLCSLLFLISWSSAQAAIGLTNISQDDLAAVVRELGATFRPSAITSADSLQQESNGERRLEIGLTSGDANISSVSALLGSYSAGTQFESAFHGALIGEYVPVPRLTAEFQFLPKVVIEGVNFNSWALGGR
jgi:hypothetical protein